MSWLSILRLGVVNACLGGVVALVTFTLNRVMTVELALPAIVPGALVALHYAVQLARPRLGFGSDVGGRRAPWIAGGLAVLCAGGALAAAAVALMAQHGLAGAALAVLAYAMVGAGVGAVGTSSLALMATQVAPARRPAAATAFWLLMIAGAVLTAAISSQLLHPFSLGVLVRVSCGIAAAALLVGAMSVWGVEGAGQARHAAGAQTFVAALRNIWREAAARRFALFVFTAMLAYSAQELILEPFAGAVFGLDPARTAALTGAHQGGVLAGMALVALLGSLAGGGRARAMRLSTMGGCVASAVCLVGLACAGLVGPAWPLRASMAALGVANGAFAVSAIGAMLGLANQGSGARAGTRMGIWGAAQAVAMGLGGLLGTGASDLARATLGSPAPAYAAVFLAQAALFLVAARLAAAVFGDAARPAAHPATQRLAQAA
jgi:BCD family chlorophyll transporter-like MFS transporter